MLRMSYWKLCNIIMIESIILEEGKNFNVVYCSSYFKFSIKIGLLKRILHLVEELTVIW